MSFNQIPGDIIPNISSFLLPRDILRFQVLSSFHYKIISKFLLKITNDDSTDIYDHICPMCGNDWISKEDNLSEYIDIDSYTHFGEYHLRNRHIHELYPTKKVTREHLLCDECENTEVEYPNIYNFKLIYYFGNYLNNYKLYVDYLSTFPWACIIKETEKEIIWNQFNCFIEYEEDNMHNLEYDEYDEYEEY
jgi:hypothetical protein